MVKRNIIDLQMRITWKNSELYIWDQLLSNVGGLWRVFFTPLWTQTLMNEIEEVI